MKELLQFAVELAEKAGEITLEYYGRPLEVETKADQTPVTVADREAEKFLRAEIEKRYPDDGIYGEEFGEKPGSSGRRWILDPIDGTKTYIRGVPLYGTLVALEEGGEPVMGVARYPATGETLAAFNGSGCFYNGEPCGVSATADLAKSTVLATNMDSFFEHFSEAALLRFLRGTALQQTWGDCYGYLLVATGRADVMVDPIVAWHDVAAFIPIINEAGGRITDLEGNVNQNAARWIASNGLLHDAVLDMLRG